MSGGDEGDIGNLRNILQNKEILDGLCRTIGGMLRRLSAPQRAALGEDPVMEILQRTALKVLCHPTKLDGPPLPWLSAIAGNVLRDHSKACRRHPECPISRLGDSGKTLLTDLQLDVAGVLQGLGERSRLALEMRYFQGHSGEDLSTSLRV